MTRRNFISLHVLYSVVLVAALLIPAVVYAQGGSDTDGDGVGDADDACPTVPGPPANYGCPYPDGDGDGVPDFEDACPNKPGPARNNGCPVVDVPAPQPGDRDGDGVTDNLDVCLDQPGPLENGGCPLPDQTAPPTPAPAPLPVLEQTGVCSVATQGYEGVRIRALPHKDADILGGLDPYQTYPVLAHLVNGEEAWYRIAAGWVAGWVTRLGGLCDGMVDIKLGPAFNDRSLNVRFDIPSPGENDPPDPDRPSAVTPVFCDGSVHPAFVDLESFAQGDEPSCAFSLFNGKMGLLFLTQDGFDEVTTNPPDPDRILIGLLLPAVQVALTDPPDPDRIWIDLLPAAQTTEGDPPEPDRILIGLLPASTNGLQDPPEPDKVSPDGILIGTPPDPCRILNGLPPASANEVTTPPDPCRILIGLFPNPSAIGMSDPPEPDKVSSEGILIGMLLPAIQGTEDSPAESFAFDVFMPGGEAYSLNFTRMGNSVEIHVFDVFTPGPEGEMLSLNFTIPGAAQ